MKSPSRENVVHRMSRLDEGGTARTVLALATWLTQSETRPDSSTTYATYLPSGEILHPPLTAPVLVKRVIVISWPCLTGGENSERSPMHAAISTISIAPTAKPVTPLSRFA